MTDFKGRGETQELILASIEYYFLTNKGKMDKMDRYKVDSANNQVDKYYYLLKIFY